MSPERPTALLIDAGNTRAKFGWFDLIDGARESRTEALDYDQIDGLGSRLEALGVRPRRVLATNVAGPVIGHKLEAVCQQQLGLPVQWLDGNHGRDLLHNRYRTGQLGADRWMGLIGLLHRVHEWPDWTRGVPMLLATFGTATTLDTIALRDGENGSPQAHFLGGLILPGPVLMARSLADHTAHLPFAEGTPTDYPVDTHNAISSGIAAAQAGALLRQWRNGLRSATAQAALVFVSGGGWPLVRPEVEHGLARAQADLGLPLRAARHLDNPVLDGLARLALEHGMPRRDG
ncbi:type III pantothenate kinase [Castellaniella sp. GW247-6E4]|uniref:type III pantothenate kinase n=1 Tax=Castellaniella sp. GW247-6E4 TaxID=3140380 RepID=UPI0033146E48